LSRLRVESIESTREKTPNIIKGLTSGKNIVPNQAKELAADRVASFFLLQKGLYERWISLSPDT